MTQAWWDHRRLLSLTKTADNGRASAAGWSRGDGEYQLPAARYQLQVMPSCSSHCGQCTLARRSRLSGGFSTLRSLVTASVLANTQQFAAETRWSASYIAYSHYMDALEAYSLISPSQQVTTGRLKAVVYTGEIFVLDLSVGPYVNCLFKDSHAHFFRWWPFKQTNVLPFTDDTVQRLLNLILLISAMHKKVSSLLH